MDRYSLIAQATYQGIQYALYQEKKILEKSFLIKTETCRLMHEFNVLLARHNLNWSQISLLGANQGPAPFTTLRALITTLNGIGFASNIPLTGVDGLTSFYKEQATLHQNKTVIIMLNAFGNDIYYAFEKDGSIKTGWHNAANFIMQQTESAPKNLYFAGNGALLHKDLILEKVGSFDAQQCAEEVSLESIALDCFKKQQKVSQLVPLYLKTQNFK
ncbi:MAG: hypothetical protein EBU90_10935 [Proteobacteria bacterium]|nr:hypothetical protein [Pseudomonadota bacterium]NBP14715.1 hypothetical protein [bacterium]